MQNEVIDIIIAQSLEIFHYESRKSGPRIAMLGGIHGNEKKPPLGLIRLIKALNKFDLEAGQLTIAPICNPLAYAANQRSIDKRNLGRMIRHYPDPKNSEEYFADQVASVIDEADVVLDLHTCTAKTKPAVILDYPSTAINAMAAAQGLKYHVTGWPEMNKAASEIPEPDATSYAVEHGKIAIAVECGQHDDSMATEVAYLCARRTLAHFGMLNNDEDIAPLYKAEIYDIQASVINRGGAMLIPDPINMGRINKNDPIAIYPNNRIIHSPFEGVMVLPSKTAPEGEPLTYLARRISPQKPNLDFLPAVSQSSVRRLVL